MEYFRACALIGVALTACAAGAQHAPQKTAEQTHFSAEADHVDHPVPIPMKIRSLLAKDEMVREAAQYDQIPPEDFPEDWFSASAIHLGPSKRLDYVLVGKGPMLGANITQFWVFCASGDTYRLALQVGAHDLNVTDRVTKGYREIQLLSATGVAVHEVKLRFDGEEYKAFYDQWQSTE